MCLLFRMTQHCLSREVFFIYAQTLFLAFFTLLLFILLLCWLELDQEGRGSLRKPGTVLWAAASSGQLGSGDAPCSSGALWQSPPSPSLASSSSFNCQPDSQLWWRAAQSPQPTYTLITKNHVRTSRHFHPKRNATAAATATGASRFLILVWCGSWDEALVLGRLRSRAAYLNVTSGTGTGTEV